jgi:hypothetical protein
MLKKIFVLMLYCNVCSAVDLNTIEAAAAFLTIPAAMAQNNMATNPQKNAHHLLNISVDLLRLTSEILSIINNKNNEFDYHKYDICWATYDAAGLVKHIYSLFHKPEAPSTPDPHANLLIVAEGLCRFIAAMSKGTTIDDAHSRLICKSLNSALRLIDNIMSSKENSPEQIAYATALVISALISCKDLCEISAREEALRRAEAERLRQIRAQEIARREAEEAQARRVREEEARAREEEARVRAIREAEEARAREEEARQRKIREDEEEQARMIREQEEARRQAEVANAKNLALQRPEGDPLRIAWEKVSECKEAVTSLEAKSNRVHNDLELARIDVIIAPRSTSGYEPFHRIYPPNHSPYEYEQWRREDERIERTVQTALSKELARNRVRKLSAKAVDVDIQLGRAHTAAADAEATAMRLSKEQGII